MSAQAGPSPSRNYHSNNTRTITITIKSLPELLWCNVLISTTHAATTPHEMSKTSAQWPLKKKYMLQQKTTPECRGVTSILGNVPEIVASCSSSSVFRPLGDKLPAGCEETEERSADRERHCVYIWSQISLMDWEGGVHNFYAHLAPSAAVNALRFKNTTSAEDFQNKTLFSRIQMFQFDYKLEAHGYCREVSLSQEHSNRTLDWIQAPGAALSVGSLDRGTKNINCLHRILLDIHLQYF